jgi:carboxymethylenebutenolidase
MGQSIHIPTEGMQCIGAYRADPAGSPRGGIVVVQEIFGVNAHVCSVVDRYAEQGYVAIAPALFDYVEAGVDLPYDEAGMQRGKQLSAEVGLDRAVAAVASAAEAIGSAGRVGVVGYCWGGTVAFLGNTRLGLPSVTYYGARSVPFLGEKTNAPLMFHFGEQDPSIPAADIQTHRDALPQAEIFTYPTGHAFNRDVDPKHYDPASAALALKRTLDFFAKNLASG